MKKSKDIADVLLELSSLYEFYKQLKGCNFKHITNSNEAQSKKETENLNNKLLNF